jgi:thiol-disulfide isomerase/thioredoxin
MKKPNRTWFVCAFLLTCASCLHAAEVPGIIADDVAQAKAAQKLLVVDAWADWCGWCSRMDRTLANERVKSAMNGGFQYRKLDNSDGSLDKVIKDYGVTGYPCFLVIDPISGKVVARNDGYSTPTDFTDFLTIANLEQDRFRVGQPTCVFYVALADKATLEDDSTIDVVRIYRLGSLGKDEPVTRQRTGVFRAEKWGPLTLAASRANGNYLRSEFAKLLLAPPEADAGKLVFFQDRTGANVSPASIGLADATIVSDSLLETVHRLETLATVSPKPSPFTGFVIMPTRDDDIPGMFGKTPTATPEMWIDASVKFANRLKATGIDFVGMDAIRNIASKQVFLKRLEEAENIIFVACHADKAVISIPGKEPFTIEPKDIALLTLGKHPFVFLRVCETERGDNAQFANAFIHAGASGVCVNTGVISPAEAAEHTISFYDRYQKTGSIEAALKSMPISQRVMSALHAMLEWVRTFVA